MLAIEQLLVLLAAHRDAGPKPHILIASVAWPTRPRAGAALHRRSKLTHTYYMDHFQS